MMRPRRLNVSEGGSCLPRRPYTLKEPRKRKMGKANELQSENSEELSSLPESETQEKISEATTSTPLSSVHKQMEALALEKNMQVQEEESQHLRHPSL